MQTPFTRAEFFEVLVAYNRAVWPAPLLLAVLALGAVALAGRRRRAADRLTTGVLGLLWVWMAVAYHWAFFTDINPAAWLFGTLFLVQGGLFLTVALGPAPLRYRPEWDVFGLLGAVFMGYGLVLYPMLASGLGHTFPGQPTFGLPCPTTIFTVGLLLWARPRVHPGLLVVPVAWSLVGASAAWLFGVVEDLALPLAGVVGGAAILLRNRRGRASGAV